MLDREFHFSQADMASPPSGGNPRDGGLPVAFDLDDAEGKPLERA